MSWIAAGIGVGTAVYSGIRAAKQKKDAQKLSDQNRFPTQEVPQAAQEAEKIAENNANVGLPGATYAKAQQDISRSAASALSGAKDKRGGLALIPYIQQQTNDANLGLNSADAQMRNQNRNTLLGQKGQMAEWQNNIWDWNKRQRYIQNAAAVRGLLGASRENMNNAIDRGLGAATTVGGYYAGGGNNSWGGNGDVNEPIYANGYNQNSNYGDFQTEY